MSPRLSSLEKGGYYAFPREHLPAIASQFEPALHGGKLLDPCAGEGEALQHLAEAWKLQPYANELDTDRAAACQALFGLTQAVQGDLYTLRASLGSFPAIWLNPPYTWEMTGSDDKRRELAMLKHSWKWLQAGGWMLWTVYGHHVTPDAAAWLAKRCQLVDVWRLPGLHLGEYVHVVVVAHEGAPPNEPAQFAQRILQDAATPRELTMQDTPLYTFPQPRTIRRFVFAPQVMTPQLALQAVQTDGAQFGASFQRLLEPPPPVETVRPVVRPRGGQLALVLAAGLFNGIVVQTEEGRAAVRSTVEPVEQLVDGGDIDESDETTTDREVYRTRPQVTITLLNEQGEVTDMSGDAALVDFIGRHKAALLDYLGDHFTPLYDFDYGQLAPILDRVRIKGNRLYETQKHVIASTYTALQQRKGVIIVGEPGVGKTALGAALALALRPQMKADQVVLVMSPPHLTGKWQREVEMVARSVGARVHAKVLKNVDDVRAFMDANLPMTLKVGIIPREMAKLGEGWEPAVQWRTVRTARWAHGEPRPENLTGERILTTQVPLCPNCGATITRNKNGEAIIADEKWLGRAPQKCPSCGGALWQFTRTFSAPKPGEKYPKRNPRMPLADYIATVFPDRVYLFMADEVHELKSTSTDQGAALMTFAQTAEKVVGLTGTLYGGTASSLYGLEFVFNPRVRVNYPWGVKGQAGWVRDMGALERIVEYRPEYDKGGHYTGKRRVEHKPKEAPGCSPLLVREIIDHTVFVGLQDIGRDMPEFEEIPVPIPMDADMALHYQRAKDRLSTYLFQCRMEGDASFLGRYLQTLLAWPTAPFRGEKVIHKRRFDRESDEFIEIPVHDMPGLAEDRLYPKEAWLVELVRDELAQGRNVGVFLRQTGTRDIQPRIERIIREHVPGARPYVLKGSVAPERRESLVQQQLDMGINVLVCNPRLVQTGLDLVAFPTLVFLEPDYSLFVMGQASRRAWRIIQDQPCKTYYPHYIDTMEHQATELIGRKQQAANLLYGDTSAGGLSELTGANGGGGDLLAELAKAIDQDDNVTDLRDLFARHAQQADPTDSAWFVAEGEPAHTVEGEDDLLRFGVEELGGVMVEMPESIGRDTPQPILSPTALPPRKKVRRRRKVAMLDAPETDEAPIQVPDWPMRQPEHVPLQEAPEVRQLALF
ncbi:MAG TPA: DUF6094 domain-containing protein [Bellilinea sp.]|nr:DUF6094 domain-containing protein [Bellilinea sp.]